MSLMFTSEQSRTFKGWNRRSLFLLIGIVTSCLSLFFLIYGASLLYRTVRLESDGVKAVASEVHYEGAGVETYRFLDAAGSAHFTEFNLIEVPNALGSGVSILYNPAYPGQAVVDSWWIWILGIFSILFGGFMGLGIFIRRKIFFEKLNSELGFK